MPGYSLSHLSDSTLLSRLAALAATDRTTTAALLAHVAEVDARKLYLAAGYPSMYAYCVGELQMSEDIAYKRIRAARAARRFPGIFEAVADGRLTLSAGVLLAPCLTQDTAEGLIVAATHRTNAEIERLLAERFPQPDLPTQIRALAAPTGTDQLAVRPVGGPTGELAVRPVEPSAPAPTEPSTPARPEAPAPRPRVTPLAPERFALQVTIGQGTYDKLRYAQVLLGHGVSSTELAAVLDRALDQLIATLERQKFAACSRSTPRRHAQSTARRYIPAEVRHAVWQRDGGQCTFTSEAGRRCEANTRLEFDHVLEFARGGEATVDGIRLRCRAHNQYQAEQTFGAEFMRHKRIAAAEARTAARRQGTAP